MKTTLAALGCGILFGLGLTVSDMTNPDKIISFLDVAGGWDPSLLVVMAAALAVSTAGYHFVLKTPKPAFDSQFHLPTSHAVDRPLMLGALLFGIGWGLGGLCPGPAVASITIGGVDALVFLAAMAAGMASFTVWSRIRG